MFLERIWSNFSYVKGASRHLPIIGIGTVYFEMTEAVITIDNILFVPDFSSVIFVLTKFEHKNVWHNFENSIQSLKIAAKVI